MGTRLSPRRGFMYSPAKTADHYAALGAAKTRKTILHLLVQSIMAGVFVALAAMGSQAVAVSVPWLSLGKFLGACIFPAGLTMVIASGSELFTGNVLLIIPTLDGRTSPLAMLRNWALVYLGNLIGSLFVAYSVTRGHTLSLFDNALAQFVVDTAVNKVNLTFGEAVIRGVLCNILVCTGVWIGTAAKDMAGKVIGIFFPIMLFVLCGFEQCVANMFFIPAGLFALKEYGISAPDLTWASFFVRNLLPATLGNIIGGAGMVGCTNWLCYLKREKY